MERSGGGEEEEAAPVTSLMVSQAKPSSQALSPIRKATASPREREETNSAQVHSAVVVKSSEVLILVFVYALLHVHFLLQFFSLCSEVWSWCKGGIGGHLAYLRTTADSSQFMRHESGRKGIIYFFLFQVEFPVQFHELQSNTDLKMPPSNWLQDHSSMRLPNPTQRPADFSRYCIVYYW